MSASKGKIVVAATVCATAVIASQIVGKAARDAIFLHNFEVTYLPVLLAVSSAIAIGTTFVFARQLARGAPMRVVQIANLASAVLFVVEWFLLPYFPRPIAIAIYVHQTLMGPLLVSGFWSIFSECFDPRTARGVVATIATGATIGGLLGALIAERVAAMIGTNALLPTIACLQLLASWRLASFGSVGTSTATDKVDGDLQGAVPKILRVSLLRRLAMITVIVTVAAALLDYAFKSMVRADIASSDDLARVFAVFHGVVGLLTAVLSWSLGRRALQRWGLANTLATLPGSVIVFGAFALFAPGIGAIVALRGVENVVRNSLYREAYEVFYTPLGVHERRATKTVIDVGVERFGDVLGGIALLVILALVTASTPVLIAGSIGLSVLGVVVALQAQRSYVQALERSLLARAIELEVDDVQDRTTRTTMALLARGGRATDARRSRWPFPLRRLARGALDPTLKRLVELTSGNAARIRKALTTGPLSPAGVAHALPLLARPEIAVDVRRALAEVAASCVGQLTDAAYDRALGVGIRAQLPALIAIAGGDRARAGLLACLADPELEVRYHAAQALLAVCERDPAMLIDHEAVFAGVRRELAVEATTWAALELATSMTPPAAEPHISRVAHHLGSLLALALPTEPVKTAIFGLWSEDVGLRGVSLEYLENVLPADIRERMWTVLAIDPVATPAEKHSLDAIKATLKARSLAMQGTHDTNKLLARNDLDRAHGL